LGNCGGGGRGARGVADWHVGVAVRKGGVVFRWGWTVVQRKGRRRRLATRTASTDGADGVDKIGFCLPGGTVTWGSTVGRVTVNRPIDLNKVLR